MNKARKKTPATPIALTIYRGAKHPVPAAQDEFTTWDEVADEIEAMTRELTGASEDADPDTQKEALLAFGPYALREPYRKNENVDLLSLLVIDVDRGDPYEVRDYLESLGVAAVIYASPSDAPEARRFRVVVPVSRPIASDECRESRLALAETLGLAPGCGAEGAIDPSKLFFIGRLHGTPEREVWRLDGAPLDVDTLLATPPALDWGTAQAPVTALVPLGELPPADAGIVAALGPWTAHAGRKWNVCGALGGLMRKMHFSREQCEATIREWLPSDDRTVDVEAGVAHALGAWSKPAVSVSGVTALAQLIGDEHARVVSEACVAARFPDRAAARAMIDNGETDEMDAADPDAFPGLNLDRNKQGRPFNTPLNCARVAESVFGERIRYEEFRGRIVCAGIDESIGRFPDGPWTDEHTTAFLVVCNELKLDPNASTADRAVALHAKTNAFNALRDWLTQCAAAWDGVSRVDSALTTYWGAEDAHATRATSRVFLLSLAARGLNPGCKVDTCPVAIGEQGKLKSQSFEKLVGLEWFSDSPLPIGDKEALQNIRGKWLWELAELASTSRRDPEAVKAFLSSRQDTFRASYGRHSEDVPRTCTFVGSSNKDAVLFDPTGGRRFLPFRVGTIDLPAIQRDREQLLGEAATRIQRGEQWWPTAEERQALEGVHAEHEEHDVWEGVIGDWLARRRPGVPEGVAFVLGDDAPFELAEVFHEVHGAIPLPPDRVGKAEQNRAANALRRLGFQRGPVERQHSKLVRLWRSVAT